MKTRWEMIGVAALLFTACVPVVGPGQVGVEVAVPGIVVDPVAPYYFSHAYCAGCWYGQWGGRTGYHRGGGSPWARPHVETDHHGHDHGRDVQHEGHR